jgi:hypothetical protein
MEPSVSNRIPPPAWAGRPPLLRVLGERYVEAATLCVVGLVAGAAAVVLADDRLFALIAIAAVAGAVAAVTLWTELSDLRKAAAEAPVADERPSRLADRGEYLMEAAPSNRMGALLALVPHPAAPPPADRPNRRQRTEPRRTAISVARPRWRPLPAWPFPRARPAA